MGDTAYREFLRADWDLDFRAELYKEEFFASRSWALDRDNLVDPWPGSTRDELADLVRLKTEERLDHVGEIIREQQALVMIGYWYALLKFGPKTHPHTTELLTASMYLAGAVATYAKARFNRVRPSLLAPDLAPPIPLPGHPAYPSGHSTQMYLMALVLAELVPMAMKQLFQQAATVARNRERAGLNYRSDTEAGQALAQRIFKILKDDCRNTFGKTLRDARKSEWASA